VLSECPGRDLNPDPDSSGGDFKSVPAALGDNDLGAFRPDGAGESVSPCLTASQFAATLDATKAATAPAFVDAAAIVDAARIGSARLEQVFGAPAFVMPRRWPTARVLERLSSHDWPVPVFDHEDRPAARARVVYVVRRPGMDEAKIGVAKHLARRLRSLQAGHGRALEVVLSFGGGEREEAELHWYFRRDRLLGEWFTLSQRMLDWIRRQRVHLEGGAHGHGRGAGS